MYYIYNLTTGQPTGTRGISCWACWELTMNPLIVIPALKLNCIITTGVPLGSRNTSERKVIRSYK